jgi:hypothetical protein
MAVAYHGEGPIVIRAAYDGTTATAYFEGSAATIATGTGGDREAAINDCIANLSSLYPQGDVVNGGSLTTGKNRQLPILILPTLNRYPAPL